MGKRHIFGITASVLLATAAVVGFTAASAGACTLIAHSLTATQDAVVGAPVVVSGTGFFHLDGGDPAQLAADCTGADFAADTDITIEATFQTPNGPLTISKPAKVIEGGSFELEPLSFDPPPGSTDVSVTAKSSTDPTYSVPPFELPLYQALISASVPVTSSTVPTTMTSIPAAAPPAAAPAEPVATAATFTG